MANGNYYDITINGIHFRGGRLWIERWNIIKNSYNYKDLKILDLGCGLGLNTVCLKNTDVRNLLWVLIMVSQNCEMPQY